MIPRRSVTAAIVAFTLAGLCAHSAADQTSPPIPTGGGGAIEAFPLRAAPSIIQDGRVVIVGEWVDLTGPSPRGGCDSPLVAVFDCYEADPSGVPTGGIACGQTVNDWRWWLFSSPGVLLNNTLSANDMSIPASARGAFAKQARIAWKWQVAGTGTSERCYISLATAEGFGAACGPPAFCGEYAAVTIDMGTLASTTGYYHGILDMCPTALGWQMPFDGQGSYIVSFGRDVVGGDVVPATSAQPVLWGTGDGETPPDGRVGSQGALQWDDTAPRDGIIADDECAGYNLAGVCPTPLGSAVMFMAPSGGRDLLTRSAATSALLAAGSGVAVDTARSAVWLSPLNFGFGAARTGLLPQGSIVTTPHATVAPSTLATPSYLFWIDDALPAGFSHPTRLVLIDATSTAPTVANGGITVIQSRWWPRVTIGCEAPVDFFMYHASRATNQPPGAGNPQGLIAGPALTTPQISGPPAPQSGPVDFTRHALILVGGTSEHLQNSAGWFANDLTLRCRVSDSNIRTAGLDEPLDANGFIQAIDAFIEDLLALLTPPSRVYVRIATNGLATADGGEGISLNDGRDALARDELAAVLGRLRALNVPVSVIIDAPHSGGLPMAGLWNLTEGGSVITSANPGFSSFAGSFIDGAQVVTSGLLPYLLSTAAARAATDTNSDGDIDDVEAFERLRQLRPCLPHAPTPVLTACAFGIPPGQPEFYPDPRARRFRVGTRPRRISLNVPNTSGQSRASCVFLFDGDATGITAVARASNAAFNAGAALSGTFAPEFFPESGFTEVTWTGGPVAIGAYVNFAFGLDARGLKLDLISWLPPSGPPLPADQIELWRVDTRHEPGVMLALEINNQSALAGGPGVPVTLGVQYRFAPSLIAPANLNPANPAFAQLPVADVGVVNINSDDSFEHWIFIDDAWDYGASSLVSDTSFEAGQLADVRMLSQFDPVPRLACDADFDQDGDVGTDADIEAFFAALGGTYCPRCASVDLDNDGDTGTDADIETFFRLLAGGPCR